VALIRLVGPRVVLSIVYLRRHYLVAALDGVLYVAAAAILVEALHEIGERGVPHPPAPSTPATPPHDHAPQLVGVVVLTGCAR